MARLKSSLRYMHLDTVHVDFMLSTRTRHKLVKRGGTLTVVLATFYFALFPGFVFCVRTCITVLGSPRGLSFFYFVVNESFCFSFYDVYKDDATEHGIYAVLPYVVFACFFVS